MFELKEVLTESDQAFIDFSAVNHETDIRRLNLNWRESDLPERERTKHVHRLHPYLGKYIPQLVEIFLRKYGRERVVDPFCGSGTTLVEASVLGLDCFGVDISEFNCLLSQVKTGQYDLGSLEAALTEAYQGAEALLESNADLKLNWASEYLTTWYSARSLKELFAYREQINRSEYASVMKIILSRAARSARLAAHYDLDFPEAPVTEPYYCRKHKRICKPTEQALSFLKKYTLDTIQRIKAYSSIRKNSTVVVTCGDARQIKFPECDLVMTSPPYVGLIDYHEQHRYAYELLGLPDRSGQEIGPASRGKGKAARQSYVEDMTAVFDNLYQKVVRGGTIVVVVHDRYELYPGIGRRLGLKTEAVLVRQVNRRTGRRAGDFYEKIYVWKK
ncbi:MAG: site-specific DNA-methyltransferase [Syntrophomonadaceae bacterium]|nr:site-specific DNA-methyltransferase [Syntrophomonadaceae bacterium]